MLRIFFEVKISTFNLEHPSASTTSKTDIINAMCKSRGFALNVKECTMYLSNKLHELFRTGKWMSHPYMTSKLGPKMDHVCLGLHTETEDAKIQG